MVWALTVKGQGMDQHLFKNKAEWKESQLSPKTLKLDENPQKCSEQKEHSGEKNGWMEGWITEWLDIWNEDKLFNRETEANQWDRSRYRNTQCMLSLQLYLTLYNPMGCSPPGSSVHGILQARTLEWVAVLSSKRELFLGMHNSLKIIIQLAYGGTQICSQRRSSKEFLCRKLLILLWFPD